MVATKRETGSTAKKKLGKEGKIFPFCFHSFFFFFPKEIMREGIIQKLVQHSVCYFTLLLCLEKRCIEFIRQNLRAPPISLVQQWGRKLKLPPRDIQDINSRIILRGQLGNIF